MPEVTDQPLNDPAARYELTQSGTLTNDPSAHNVKTGAGGTTVVQDTHADGFIGVSQSGVLRTESGMPGTQTADIFAGSPALTPGALLGNLPELVADMMTWATGFYTPSTSEEPEEAPDTFSLFSGAATLKKEDALLGSANMATKFGAITPELFGIAIEEGQKAPPDLGAQCAHELQKGILSGAEDDVNNALLCLVDIDSLPLTPTQKDALKGKLALVAKEMLNEENKGLVNDLKSSNPEVVRAALTKLFSKHLTDEEKASLGDSLGKAAGSIASMNAAASTEFPEDPLYISMNSVPASSSKQDIDKAKAEILSALCAMSGLQGAELSAVKPQLELLAENIAKKNALGESFGLDSANKDTLLASLAKLLGFEDPALLTGSIATALMAIVDKYAKINEARYKEMLYSTDPKVVEKGLLGLSNLQYDTSLTADQKQAVGDYLKIMSQALAFMSTIRASITVMEGMLKKLEAQGKLAQIGDMTKVATEKFNTTMGNLLSNLNALIEQKKHDELMSWLMPVITALVAVVAIAITIATLGAAGPLAIALIAVTVAMTVFMIVEQTTKCLDKALEAAGVTDPVQKAAINFAIQLAITIIVAAATFGAAAPAMAGNIAARGALIVTSEAVAMGLMCASTLMSSGLVTVGFTTLFKMIPGVSDELATYLALAVTILLTLAMLAVAIKFGGSAADNIKKAADKVDDAASVADDVGTSSAAAAKTGASASTAAGGTVSSAASAGGPSTSTLMNFLRRLQELFKEPETYVQIARVVQAGAQVSAQAFTIKHELTMRDIKLQMADLANAQAEAQALVDYLKGLLPNFDIAMDGLNNDAEQLMTFMTSLMRLFKDMVDSASTITTNLHHQS